MFTFFYSMRILITLIIMVGGVVAQSNNELHHSEIEKTAVYKESLGEVHYVEKYWNVVTNIQLETYMTYIRYARNLDVELNKICTALGTHKCEVLTQNIGSIIERIEGKEIIFEHLFDNQKSKRSLFDGVGESLKILFGTMSHSDAIKYGKQLNVHADKIGNVINVLNEHTSIVKEIISRENQTFNNNQNKFEELYNRVQSINTQLNRNVDRYEISQQFETVFQMAMLSISNLEYEQNILSNILDSAIRGRVHYMLLPPNCLKKIIAQITETKHLELPLPARNVNVLSFYKHLELSVVLFNDTLIFEIKIPLINLQAQNLIKLTTLPIQTENGKYAYINLDKNILVISNVKQQYSLINQDELKNCKEYGNKYFICKNKPITHSLRQRNCELSLYYDNKPNDDCSNIKLFNLRSVIWIQTLNTNKYIYINPTKTDVIINCDNEARRIKLFKQGEIEIQRQCILNCDETFIHFNTYPQIKENIQLEEHAPYYAIDEEFFNKIKTKPTEIQKTMIVYKDTNLFAELENRVKQLNKIEDTDLSYINIHDKVHYGGLLVVIILILVGIVYVISTQLKKQQNKQVGTENEIIQQENTAEKKRCFTFKI